MKRHNFEEIVNLSLYLWLEPLDCFDLAAAAWEPVQAAAAEAAAEAVEVGHLLPGNPESWGLDCYPTEGREGPDSFWLESLWNKI